MICDVERDSPPMELTYNCLLTYLEKGREVIIWRERKLPKENNYVIAGGYSTATETDRAYNCELTEEQLKNLRTKIRKRTEKIK